MMITTISFSSGKISYNVPKDSIAKTIALPGNILWTDIKHPSPDELAMLDETFHFHPLAIDNCLNSFYTPKVANFDEYVFLTFYSVKYESLNRKLHMSPLNIFVGKNFVVTFHREEVSAVPEAFNMIKLNPCETLALGPDFTAYIILDLLTEGHLKMLDDLSDRIDKIEERVFTSKSQEVSNDIFRLKKEILHLRRIITPMRDAASRLTREDIMVISARVKIYFHDIHDRLFRVCETIDTYKDIVISTQELQISLISNKTNQIVKILTIITTVIMPLALISGIYGMNFRHMPELEWKYGYFAILFLMFAIAVMSLIIFKRKKWF